jgi:hypothetical protein
MIGNADQRSFKIEKENKECGVRHVMVGKDCSIVALGRVPDGGVARR